MVGVVAYLGLPCPRSVPRVVTQAKKSTRLSECSNSCRSLPASSVVSSTGYSMARMLVQGAGLSWIS